jgi:hypothetical protein
MPYGIKAPRNPSMTSQVDFNAIYSETVKPAVRLAGYTCCRGDEPELGGIMRPAVIRLEARN